MPPMKTARTVPLSKPGTAIRAIKIVSLIRHATAIIGTAISVSKHMQKTILANAATGVAKKNACVFHPNKPVRTTGTVRNMREKKSLQDWITRKFAVMPGFATNAPVRIRKPCIPVAIMFGTVSYAINSTLTIIRHARAMFGVVGNATVRMLWRIIVRISIITSVKTATRCTTGMMCVRGRQRGIATPATQRGCR